MLIYPGRNPIDVGFGVLAHPSAYRVHCSSGVPRIALAL